MDAHGHHRGGKRGRRGFTLVELLVVIGLIALLIALLVPSLFAVTGASDRASSMKRMEQIGQWMHQYSSANTQFIVPSRFNYQGAAFAGKTRSEHPNNAERFTGTWTDILWTLYADTSFPDAVASASHDYSFDSPDNALYDIKPTYDDNPFRSASLNSRGADKRYPGYFAANDFFNADPTSGDFNGWWTEGQIRQPDSSLYLIDAFQGAAPHTGEWIPDAPGFWGTDNDHWVDYRYTGDALVLFLDGHIESEGEVTNLDELEMTRNVKVRDLHR